MDTKKFYKMRMSYDETGIVVLTLETSDEVIVDSIPNSKDLVNEHIIFD